MKLPCFFKPHGALGQPFEGPPSAQLHCTDEAETDVCSLHFRHYNPFLFHVYIMYHTLTVAYTFVVLCAVDH